MMCNRRSPWNPGGGTSLSLQGPQKSSIRSIKHWWLPLAQQRWSFAHDYDLNRCVDESLEARATKTNPYVLFTMKDQNKLGNIPDRQMDWCFTWSCSRHMLWNMIFAHQHLLLIKSSLSMPATGQWCRDWPTNNFTLIMVEWDLTSVATGWKFSFNHVPEKPIYKQRKVSSMTSQGVTFSSRGKR